MLGVSQGSFHPEAPQNRSRVYELGAGRTQRRRFVRLDTFPFCILMSCERRNPFGIWRMALTVGELKQRFAAYPPLPHRHHRPTGCTDPSDPQARLTLEGGLPGGNGQERNPARHPPLSPGILETLDRIPCPKSHRGKDALPQSLRGAHRRKRPQPPKSKSASPS